MLLKIRYKKTLTYEAFVEIASGFGTYEIGNLASDIADEKDLWKQVDENDIEILRDVLHRLKKED